MPRTASERARSAPVIGVTIAAFVILGYSGYAAYPYLRGPILTLDPPLQRNTETVIAGRTVRVSALSVDGLPVALDEGGSFSVERAYPPGYTVVTVRGVDRFGRSLERTLTFVTSTYASEKIESRESRSGTSSSQNAKTDSGL